MCVCVCQLGGIEQAVYLRRIFENYVDLRGGARLSGAAPRGPVERQLQRMMDNLGKKGGDKDTNHKAKTHKQNNNT